MVAMKLLFSLFTLSFIALVGLSNAQQIVVDFSPDTTGVTSFAGLGNGYDFSVTVGESFILDQTTTISGGSFFGETGGIFGDFGLGAPVEFGIFADDGTGNPGDLVVFETGIFVDEYDTFGTTIDPDLSRYHATLNDPVTLDPGLYFFTLPGVLAIPAAATTDDFVALGIGDGGVWIGFDDDIDLDGGFFPNAGDTFFQLEGTFVPEPSGTLSLTLAAIFFACRRRRFSTDNR